MKSSLIILILSVIALVASAEPNEEKAGIYSTKPIPSLMTLLRSLAPSAKISEGHSGNRTNFICAWPDVTVRFTIVSDWNATNQIPAIKKWITDVSESQTNFSIADWPFKQLDETTACIGTVTSPHYDPEGKATALMLHLTKELNGYVFFHNAFYNYNGIKIAGVTNAPSCFKNVQ